MSDLKDKQKTSSSVLTLLAALLISLTGFVSIQLPLTPIPLVLQNMVPIVAGAILGGTQGAGATGLFLLAGALGLPVFSGGTHGLDHITSSTGGYLIGYFFASLAAGLLIGKPIKDKRTPLPKIISGILVAFILVYIPGIFQFMTVQNKTIFEAVSICVTPFLLFDGLKFLCSVIIATRLRPIIAKYIII